jgi:two-component system, sensor histidine kinase YesM
VKKILSVFSNLKLAQKIIIFFLLFTFIPDVLTGFYFFYWNIGLVQKNSFDYSKEQLSRTAQDVQEYLERLEYILSAKFTNPNFRESVVMSETNNSSPGQIIEEGKVVQELIDLVERERDIDSLYFYLDDGNRYLPKSDMGFDVSYDITKETWFPAFKKSEDNFLILGPHKNPQTNQKVREVVSIIVKGDIPFPAQSKENVKTGISRTGYLVCNILSMQIIDQFYNKPYRDKIVLTDDNGNLIFTTHSRWLVDNITQVLTKQIAQLDEGTSIDQVDKNYYFVTWQNSGIPNVKAILVTQNNIIVSELSDLNIKGIWMLVGVSVLGLLLLLLLINSITTPIRRLEESIRSVEDGNFDHRITVTSNDEIGMLSRHYNTMIGRIDELIKEIKENYKARQDLEKLVLQSQINPHFLFNTLNSIRNIAIIQNSNTVAQSLKSLITLLQSSIRIGQDFITISEEIEQIKNYVEIQKLRYCDRFDVGYEIDEHLLDCQVLKFSLQPIIENAIFHGIEAKDGPGLIKINIQQNDKNVVYRIEDNGIGFDEKQLAKISKDLDDEIRTRGFNQIGLKNVQDRIHMFFGPEYGIVIESEYGKGTIVIMTIPVVYKSDELETRQ